MTYIQKTTKSVQFRPEFQETKNFISTYHDFIFHILVQKIAARGFVDDLTAILKLPLAFE